MSNKATEHVLDRRELIKAASSGIGAAVLLGQLTDLATAESEIVPFIEAYTDQLSYQAGDEVGLCISINARRYAMEVARVGAQRKIVYTRENLPGAKQLVPQNAVSHGCQWPIACKIQIPANWHSGYYQVTLRTTDGAGSSGVGEAFFVVRSQPTERGASILLQLTTNTYNAYNRWGGASLYDGPGGPSHRVSFDRPYMGFDLRDKFTRLYSGWHNWEQPFVEWAERAGHRIDFAVNSDLEFRPEMLKRYRLVLSVGHDEYWSAPMRDHLEAFIANGGNVAFFSGNTCFWQVRSEDKGRAIVSWKYNSEQDPIYGSDDQRLLTGAWCNRLIQRPENRLTGVSFAYGGYHRFFEKEGDGDYTIHRPEHWMFAGTDLNRGDRLGSKDKIVGYECDGCRFTLQNELPVPTYADGTPLGFEILGTAPASLSTLDNTLGLVSESLYGAEVNRQIEQPGAAVLGCYTRGGTVVTTGCTEWVRGLQGRDPQVERITRNILDRLSQGV